MLKNNMFLRKKLRFFVGELQSAIQSAILPSKCKDCTTNEVAIVRVLLQNPRYTQKQIAASIGNRKTPWKKK